MRRNAAQATVRSGFRVAERGGTAHPTLAPTTAGLSPCRRWGRAGRQTRCFCCRHRCPAPRWSRSRTGSDPPRCTVRTAKGQTRRLAPVPDARALVGGLSHLGAPRLSTATASRPRPLSRPRPTPTPLGPAPRIAQPLLDPSSGLFPQCGTIHLCSLFGIAGRCVPVSHPQRAPLSCPSLAVFHLGWLAPRNTPGPRFTLLDPALLRRWDSTPTC